MRAYQRQLVDGRHVWDDYDVNALSLYPKPTYGHRTGGPEDAMRLLGKVRGAAPRRSACRRRKKIWATEVNYGVTGGGVADSAATPISERRQVANVLRTYLLGAAHGLTRVFWYRYDWGLVDRRHSRQHPALRSHELRPRARRRHGHANGGALVERPAGRPARAPPVRARPARHLPLRRPARRSRPRGSTGTHTATCACRCRGTRARSGPDVPSPATRAGTPCASGSGR